jgi:hypothetical protein
MHEPLHIAVSPYHLATRESAAMAALVLGSRVVTLLPHPAGGTSRDAVFEAIDRSPRYLRLLEAWRWSGPLWRAGIVSAESGGDAACSGLDSVYDDIRADSSLVDLRPLTREIDRLRDENAARYLDAMSNDLLRGGPDPGISIPINAALERFCARHNMVMARGPVSSVAQRAEARLGQKVFSLGVPVLLQAGGGTLLALREDLEEPLDDLRAAMVAVLNDPGQARSRNLQQAAGAYAAEFADWVDAGLARGDDDDTGKRIVAGFAGLTCMEMPTDSVLSSSRAAVRSVAGAARFGAQRRVGAKHATETVEHAGLGRFTMIIREMNIRPEA